MNSVLSAINVPPHIVSDEESLDDHSGVEDFQGVTLQMNEEEDAKLSSRRSPENKPGLLSSSDRRDSSGAADHVPRISITPMTPPSASVSPDGHSTVSLNSSGGSPLFQNQKYRGQMSMSPNLYWRPQSPMPPSNEYEAKEFFAYRDSIVQTVMDELQTMAAETDVDGLVHGSWLLTEIDHWDNEKERIVLMCEKTMIIIKYDFIAMKQEGLRRIHLYSIDKIVQGELKYPDLSLAPRLNGIAGGLVGVMREFIPTVQDTVQSVGSAVLPKGSKASQSASSGNQSTSDSPTHTSPEDYKTSKTSIMSALSLDKFEARARNVQGIRVMWNQDLPLSFSQKWNPFNKSIPWITFASHPLLWHKGGGGGINRSFDIDSFSRELMDILSHGCGGGDSSPMCRIEYKPIIIETYLGLTSLFHNANSLGFYKVRGKVSF